MLLSWLLFFMLAIIITIIKYEIYQPKQICEHLKYIESKTSNEN